MTIEKNTIEHSTIEKSTIEREKTMASVRYKNGSYYVVYAQGKPVMCHNKATAVYLVRQANKVLA
jgi:hypothetical protein